MESQHRYRGWMPDYFQTDSAGELIEFLERSDRKRACLQVMDTSVGNTMMIELNQERNLLTIEHYTHLPDTHDVRLERPFRAVTEVERLVEAGDIEGVWFYLCAEGRRLIGQYDDMLRIRDAETKAAIRRFRRTLRSCTNLRCRIAGPTRCSEAYSVPKVALSWWRRYERDMPPNKRSEYYRTRPRLNAGSFNFRRGRH